MSENTTDCRTLAGTLAVEPTTAEPISFAESAVTRALVTGDVRMERLAVGGLTVLAAQLIPDRQATKRPNRTRPRCEGPVDLPSYNELRDMAKRSGPPSYFDGDRAEENPF